VKKKVYIDTIIFDLQKAGGISLYFYEVISRFLIDNNIDLTLIDSGDCKNNIFWSKLDLSNIKIITYKKKFNRYRVVNYIENEEHIFISSYYRYSINKNATNITIVHDFTYEHFSKGLKLFVHHKQKAIAIKNSQKIICISENTKKDLLKFCPKESEEKEIVVIYNGASDKFRVLESEEFNEIENKNQYLLEIKEPFVLFVGARSGYKNWIEAIEIFKQFPQSYNFVSVGGPSLLDEEKILLSGIKNSHIYIPPVDEEVLVYLYNKAVCLMYLSNYEGFGIPVVEAQKCGCHVIAKPVSSIPEVAGEGTLLLEDDISIEKTLTFLSKEFNYTPIFSWDKCYKELINVFGGYICTR